MLEWNKKKLVVVNICWIYLIEYYCKVVEKCMFYCWIILINGEGKLIIFF